MPLNDIVCCEALGKRQRVHLVDGTVLRQSMTMTKLYEMCAPCQGLVKVGVSYIIHLGHIASLSAQEVQMDNGMNIFLPRGTYRPLRGQYMDYFCEKE